MTDVTSVSDLVSQVENKYRTLLDTFHEALLTFAPVDGAVGPVVDAVCTSVNLAAQRVLSRSAEGILGRRLGDVLFDVHVEGKLGTSIVAPDPGQTIRFETPALPSEAGDTEYEVSIYPFGPEVLVVLRDITQRLRSERALANSEARYRVLAENAMDLVVALDMHATIEWASPSAKRLLGFEPQDLVGKSGAVLIHPEDLAEFLVTADQARAGAPVSCRIRSMTALGDHRWVEATPRPAYNDSGNLVGGVIGFRDIHDEWRAHEALERQLDFDALTGLARRPIALGRIQDILDTRRSDGWALFCVGVDGMTALNQAYTYAMGDAVLRAVTDRLVSEAAAADRVARIAGDEFAILLRDVVTPTDAASAAERLLAAVRGPVTHGQVVVDVTACVGIAMSHVGADADELLRDSTAAMRQASAKGPDRWEFLDGNVGEQTRQALTVQHALKDALAESRIVPWLMPLARIVDREIVGFEALVRWEHEDSTVSPPSDFLPIAERAGLVMQIDEVMLDRVLDVLLGLPPNQHIALNVSAATLGSERLPDRVRDGLAQRGLDPRRLHLEVTETALLKVTDSVRSAMREIADLGVSWWVDDFGTGYSSIAHLRDLPIAGLKLDQSFTAGVTVEDSYATRLAKGLAGLAHGLGLLTIAEGIETIEQEQVLAAQGWSVGQGWLYGRPTRPS